MNRGTFEATPSSLHCPEWVLQQPPNRRFPLASPLFPCTFTPIHIPSPSYLHPCPRRAARLPAGSALAFVGFSFSRSSKFWRKFLLADAEPLNVFWDKWSKSAELVSWSAGIWQDFEIFVMQELKENLNGKGANATFPKNKWEWPRCQCHSQQAWKDGPDSALLGRLQRAMDQVRVVK